MDIDGYWWISYVIPTSLKVEDRDTAQYRAEQIMYGAEEDLPLEYWKDLAEKRYVWRSAGTSLAETPEC